MNNFNYKQILLYLPPILILLAVFTYYILNRNNSKQEENTQDQNNNKIIYTGNSSGAAKAFNNNDFASANKILDENLNANNQDLETLILKGTTLAQEASLTFKEKELGNQAMIYIDQALKIDPSSVAALRIKGYIYEIQENYANAHIYYDMALKIDPKNSETLSQKAHAYFLEGKETLAENYYSQSLDINFNNFNALFGLAKIYINQGKTIASEKNFLRVATESENKRQKAESYYSLSVIEANKAKPNMQKVDSYSDKAIENDSKFSLGYVSKSISSFAFAIQEKDTTKKQNFIQLSLESIMKALEINQYQTMAHLQLATILKGLGSADKAATIMANISDIISKDITLSKVEKDILLKKYSK